MRTLADMTSQERANCRGMWCETAMSKALFIYMADDQDNEEKAVVVNPKSQFRTVTPLRALTPRFDLPRAWQADGQPPLTQYWTIEQAADYTQLSTRTLHRRIAYGSLTAYRAGRAIRLKPQDIDTLFTRVEPREMEQA